MPLKRIGLPSHDGEHILGDLFRQLGATRTPQGAGIDKAIEAPDQCREGLVAPVGGDEGFEEIGGIRLVGGIFHGFHSTPSGRLENGTALRDKCPRGQTEFNLTCPRVDAPFSTQPLKAKQ